MAEIQNTFTRSKMNKDLDDRLVPNGEYRDALNIAISRSEGDDVGALETILGNQLYYGETTYNTCIGTCVDRQNQFLYYFVTDYIDSSSDGISNYAPVGVYCAVEMYNIKTSEKTTLVEGEFLNFSARSPITGVNVIEDLLFWTDNRNQPRKISISSARAFPGTSTNPYYTTEDQLSVAKYYPWSPISLMDISTVGVGVTPTNSTMTNPSQEFYANGTSAKPDYDPNWPGDPDYLSDKFIRLSYRFKFDDNEYSLMAPFTQPCFIPKQNGYFLSDDQEAAYRSTVVDFFENNVTQILANIEFESIRPDRDFKIKEVEILYKESDGLQVKAIESIPISTVVSQMATNTNPYVYTYTYISTKPYKGLPDDQIVRVYDRVPVRALAQEVAGNRVIYGNFYTTQTALETIDYSVSYGEKNLTLSTSQIEYPNHTLKQNRNYQVGFVLADRFGRQSSVILSSNDIAVDDGAGNYYGGSTIYVPYKTNAGTSPLYWPGYALRALINSPIPDLSQYNVPGYPGLYKNSNYGVDYLTLNGTINLGTGYSVATDVPTTGGTGTGLTVNILIVNGTKIASLIINNQGSGYTDGDVVTVAQIGSGQNYELIASVSLPNPLGWYSYKIVVKQTEQDYYNCYLPGILNGYPWTYWDSETGTNDPAYERGETSNIVLINDNINKIPRDLNEVGPGHKQYRSAVELFGRVSPINNNNYNFNQQYYPSIVGDTVVSISTLAEANYNDTTATGSDPLAFDINYPEFYQSNTNPSIARIKVTSPIGKNSCLPATGYQNTLAVYETEPTKSLIDIYWETTSSGLISDLNTAIQVGGYLGPVQTTGYTFDLNEGDAPGTNVFGTGVVINVVNGFSNVILEDLTFSLLGVIDATGASRIDDFWLENHPGAGTPQNPQGFRIKTSLTPGQDSNAYFYFGSNEAERTYSMLVACTYTDPGGTVYNNTLAFNDLSLNNIAPTFIEAIACPFVNIPGGQLPPNPIDSVTFPQTTLVNGAVVYTFYAQNGSLCQGGNYTNELTFSEDQSNSLPDMFELRTSPSNPGACELIMKPYNVDQAVFPNGETFDCYVKVRDAGASRVAYVEVTITAVPFVSIQVYTTSLCSPNGSWFAGQVGTGKLRNKVTFDNLSIGETYNVTRGFSNSVNASGGFPAAPCGIPTSFVASAATENYYFDINWSSAQGNAQITLDITIADATGDNENDYSVPIFRNLQVTQAVSTCPVGSPCV